MLFGKSAQENSQDHPVATDEVEVSHSKRRLSAPSISKACITRPLPLVRANSVNDSSRIAAGGKKLIGSPHEKNIAPHALLRAKLKSQIDVKVTCEADFLAFDSCDVNFTLAPPITQAAASLQSEDLLTFSESFSSLAQPSNPPPSPVHHQSSSRSLLPPLSGGKATTRQSVGRNSPLPSLLLQSVEEAYSPSTTAAAPLSARSKSEPFFPTSSTTTSDEKSNSRPNSAARRRLHEAFEFAGVDK
jgi:hypothetical protein